MEVLALLLVLGFLILPFVAIFKAFSLSGQVEALNRQIAALHQRLARLEETAQKSPAQTNPVSIPQPRELSPETKTPASPPAKPAAPPALSPPETRSVPAAKPPPLVPPLPAVRPPVSLEQFIGKKLFAWVGGLALFFGILFFVKYAFERNLIPPAARITAGYICGAGLILGGWLKRRGTYAVLAQTLSATGILVLYGVTYAAHAIYDFPAFQTGPAFVWMTAITALAIAIAAVNESKVTAVLGMLGGFLTPVLLATGEDRGVFLFSYLAVLNGGILAVMRRRGWFFLAPPAALATALLEMQWLSAHFSSGQYGTGAGLWGVLALLAGFPALFLILWRKTDDLYSALGVVILVFSGLLAGFFLVLQREAAARPEALYLCLLSLPLLLIPLAVRGRKFTAAPALAGYVLFTHLNLWLKSGFNPNQEWTAAAIILFFGLMQSGWSARRMLRDPVKSPEAGNAAALDAFPPQLTAAFTCLPAFFLFALAGKLTGAAAPAGIFTAAILYSAWLPAVHLRGQVLNSGFREASPVLALIGAVFLQMNRNFTPLDGGWRFPDFLATLMCGTLFVLLFNLWPFHFQKRLAHLKIPWVVAAMAPVAHFPLLYRNLREILPDLQPGFIPLICGVLPGLSLLLVLKLPVRDAAVQRSRIIWFSAAVLTFVTLVIAVQWKREWLTLGLALEGAALVWLHRRLPHPGLRAVAVGLLAAAFVRLALNPAVLGYHIPAPRPWLAWHFYIYTLTAASMLLAAHWLKPPHHKIQERDPRPLLRAGAGILLFLMMNLQIADFFARPGAATTVFAFRGDFARSVTYTIAWGLYALGLLGLGFRLRSRGVRYAGMGLLSVTLLKLFLFDLSGLDSIYRIAVFLAVAVIALAASFLYQRFLQDSKEEPNPAPAPVSEENDGLKK